MGREEGKKEKKGNWRGRRGMWKGKKGRGREGRAETAEDLDYGTTDHDTVTRCYAP